MQIEAIKAIKSKAYNWGNYEINFSISRKVHGQNSSFHSWTVRKHYAVRETVRTFEANVKFFLVAADFLGKDKQQTAPERDRQMLDHIL